MKSISIFLICFLLIICTPPSNPFKNDNSVRLLIKVPEKASGFNYCINDRVRFEVTIIFPHLVEKVSVRFDENADKDEQEITTEKSENKKIFFEYIYKEKGLKNVKFTITFRKSGAKRDTLFSIDIGIKPTIKNNKNLLVGDNIVLGGPLTLTVDHEKFSKVIYEWYKDSKLIPDQDQQALIFNPLKENDKGRYHCIVITDWGKDQSKIFDLDFKDNISIPKIQKDPQNIQTVVGSSARFFIKAVGNSIVYQWQRNEEDIPNANDYFYEVKDLKIEDSAVYRCIISNDVGRDTSSNAILRITKGDTVVTKIAPIIIKNPKSQRAEVGDTVQFSIKAEGTDLIYQWFKNNNKIEDATGADFQIGPVLNKSNGSYYCIISNDVGEDTSNTVLLTIITKPEILIHPKDTTVIVGEIATFTIDAKGSGLKYQWFENGKEINQATKDTYSIKTTLNHNGKKYYCIAMNDHTSDTSNTAILTVKAVNNPPKWKVESVSLTTKEGITINVDLLKHFDKDPDGDEVTFVKKSGYGLIKNNIWSWAPDFKSGPAVAKTVITAKDNGYPNMTGDITISVTVEDSVCVLNYMVNSGRGKIVPHPSGTEYTPGTKVLVTAVPKEGYVFEKWLGDIGNSDSTSDSIEIIMDVNKTISGIFTKASETVVLNVDEFNIHGLRYVNGYYFACTQNPAKLLKFDANDISDYKSVAFRSNYMANDLVHVKKTDKLYVIFGIGTGVQMAEVDPHTLEFNIKTVHAKSSMTQDGQSITTDNNGHLYIGISCNDNKESRVTKYSLSTYTVIESLSVARGYIHAIRYDDGYLYATGTSKPPWVLKINANTLVAEQGFDIDGITPTDDFGITKNHLFIGLETNYLHEKSGLIYRISKDDISKMYPIKTGAKDATKGLGDGYCYAVEYYIGYIWALFDASPGIITRIDPKSLDFKNYKLDYNRPNEIASDGKKLFITYWGKNPGRVQVINPLYLNGKEIK